MRRKMKTVKVTLKLAVELDTEGLDPDEIRIAKYDLFDRLGGIGAEQALLEEAGMDVASVTILDVVVGR